MKTIRAPRKVVGNMAGKTSLAGGTRRSVLGRQTTGNLAPDPRQLGAKVAELPGPRNRSNVTGRDQGSLPLRRTEDVYLFGEITDVGAKEVLWSINEACNAGRQVRLWICSIGGDLGGALAIHDALQRYPDLEAIATGNCQSAALVAFLGAKTRWATPNTIFHNHAVVGIAGEHLAMNFSLEALDRLRELPIGTFDPEEARQCGLILDPKTAPLRDLSASAGGGDWT